MIRFLFVLLFAVPALAEDILTELPWNGDDGVCTTQEAAQKYIRDFNIDIQSFGGIELCSHQTDSKKLFDDLEIIAAGRFHPTQTNLLIKGYVAADQYYSWMKSQTRGMERGNDIPFATAYNSGGYFTMQNGWSLLSSLGRVGTVIHEARHTAGYRHTPCQSGPYAESSVSGCDRDYAQAGSHAVEMEYYARVAVAGQNFHPVYKAMARLMAMGRTNFVFNKSPIQKREGLLTINQMGQTQLIDGSIKVSRETNGGKGRLKRTSFGASLFDGIQATAIELYEFFESTKPISDDYSYFKLLKEDRGQGTQALKDFEEIDIGIKRYAIFLNQKNELGSYLFPQGHFSDTQNTNTNLTQFLTTDLLGNSGLFALSDGGEILRVDPVRLSIQPTGQILDNPWSQIIRWNSTLLGLDSNGSIYRQIKGQWILDENFDGQFIEQMTTVPLYDAFQVQ